MLGKSIAAEIIFCAALVWSATTYAQTGIDLTSSDRTEIWRVLGRDAMRTQIPGAAAITDVAQTKCAGDR